ncbi:hypothetical protein PG984_011206 [Apiospora sp. TS-2023a]
MCRDNNAERVCGRPAKDACKKRGKVPWCRGSRISWQIYIMRNKLLLRSDISQHDLTDIMRDPWVNIAAVDAKYHHELGKRLRDRMMEDQKVLTSSSNPFYDEAAWRFVLPLHLSGWDTQRTRLEVAKFWWSDVPESANYTQVGAGSQEAFLSSTEPAFTTAPPYSPGPARHSADLLGPVAPAGSGTGTGGHSPVSRAHDESVSNIDRALQHFHVSPDSGHSEARGNIVPGSVAREPHPAAGASSPPHSSTGLRSAVGSYPAPGHLPPDSFPPDPAQSDGVRHQPAQYSRLPERPPTPATPRGQAPLSSVRGPRPPLAPLTTSHQAAALSGTGASAPHTATSTTRPVPVATTPPGNDASRSAAHRLERETYPPSALVSRGPQSFRSQISKLETQRCDEYHASIDSLKAQINLYMEERQKALSDVNELSRRIDGLTLEFHIQHADYLASLQI